MSRRIAAARSIQSRFLKGNEVSTGLNANVIIIQNLAVGIPAPIDIVGPSKSRSTLGRYSLTVTPRGANLSCAT